MPRGTPFHPRTSALCESRDWQEWSGYLSANTYELEHTREYYAIRTAAGLLDVSPLYKYHIAGPDALALINRVVTRDVSTCAVGQAMYTPWCDETGKVVDDGIVARLDEERIRLTAADPNLLWLEDNAVGLNVEIEDVSEAVAALALQGPMSHVILAQLTDADIGSLRYFHLMQTTLDGIPATVSRTGYTGDLGYEIWIDAEHAVALWDKLMAAGTPYKMRPVGNYALDIARIEAGLLLIQVDFISARHTLFDVQKTSPYELGLDWAVALDKGYFVGRDALRREKQNGPTWTTVGLEIQWESLEDVYRPFGMPPLLPTIAWSEDVPVYGVRGLRRIGKATSGTWSPVLKKYIALTRVPRRYAKPGTEIAMEVTVEAHRKQARAVVVDTPFYEPERKRALPDTASGI